MITRRLLFIAALSVTLVVLLIVWVRMPAFLALATGSLIVGLAARMPLPDIPRAFQAGVGDTLGFVAMVIGLGTVMGKLLAESGGAGVVSAAVIRAMGVRRLDWAMMLSGFVIGLPVFFQVGLVLLAPVMFTVAQTTGTPLLRLGTAARRRAVDRTRPGAAASRAGGRAGAASRRCRPHPALLAHRRAPDGHHQRAAVRAVRDGPGLVGAGDDGGAAGRSDSIGPATVAGDHAADDPDAGAADAGRGAGAGAAASVAARGRRWSSPARR